jgi:VWFA-related protein
MTRVPALAAAVLALAVAGADGRTQQPVFSSRVEAVRVDVLVVDQGRVVPGLTAADFELRDNDVLQEITSLSQGDAPVSVVLALDVSKSMAGARLDELRSAGHALVDGLGAGDRAGIVAFSHVVTQPAPITPELARVRAALDAARAGGDTALVDGTQAALVLGEAEVGRSLLVVFSDGVDTASFLPEDRVLEAARRSNAVVYGVWAGGTTGPAFLRALTEATGGRLLDAAGGPALRQAFVEVLREARQRYLLAFVPTGVAPGGWHTLSVKVKGRRATVRARTGYAASGSGR